MHSTVPVPSKGALRALRNLALGTSFTVAFSTAVLTEDRRQRIQAACEVRTNKTKLKSSNKYNKARSLASFDTFEAPLPTRQDEWVFQEPKAAKLQVSGLANDRSSFQVPASSLCLEKFKQSVVRRIQCTDCKSTNPLTNPDEAPDQVKQSDWGLQSLQEEHGIDVLRVLDGEGAVPTQLNATAEASPETTEEGPHMESSEISPENLVANSMFPGTFRPSLHVDSSSLLPETALQPEITDEESPCLPLSYSTIRELMVNPKSPNTEQLDEVDRLTKMKDLSQAASIFLKISWEPEPPNSTTKDLGERLCRELCYWGLPDFALEIYWRLNAQRVGNYPVAGDCYIAAHHALCNHKTVVEYFETMYKFEGGQETFYDVGNAVFKSAVAAGLTPDAMESLLIAVFQMTKEHSVKLSTSWVLKVMGYEWATNHDLSRIRALFERVEPYTYLIVHAIAVQALLIQYCIEAGQEDIAAAYYNKFKELNPNVEKSVPILGNFAFARAMQNDWTGVDEMFQTMHSLKPLKSLFNDKFVPVLKVFAKSHSVSETEFFLCGFIDRYDLRLTTLVQNIMVDAYGKAKEIEPLARWIRYSASVGCSTDAATFRTILNIADRYWGFSFDQTYDLYELVQGKEPSKTVCVDEETIALLQRIAVYQACGDSQQALRNLKRINRDCFAPPKLTTRGVQSSMSLALKLGKPIQALGIYKTAQSHGVPLHYSHLTLAVTASLRLHNACVEETGILIREAAQRGVNISPALVSVLTFQMSKLEINSSQEADKIVKSVTDAIFALEKEGIDVSSLIVTHAASVLERQGYPRHTIHFWKSMAQRAVLTPETLDIPMLTVLLRAYVAIRSSDGIKWVMHILMTNKLEADKTFKLVLRNAWKAGKKLADKTHLPTEISEYYKAVTTALEHVKMLRQFASVEREYFKKKATKIIDQALSRKLAGRLRVQTAFVDDFKMDRTAEYATAQFQEG